MTEVSSEFFRAYALLEQDYVDCRNEIEATVVDDPEKENVLNKLVAKYEPIRQTRMQGLGEMMAGFSEAEKALHQQWIKETGHWKNIQEAPFCWRIINKPEGYPGDYKLMEMIYDQRQEGKTDWEKFIHKQAVDSVACQAVRNRKELLRDQILQLNVRGGGGGG